MVGLLLVMAVAFGAGWPLLRERGLLARFGVAPKSAPVLSGEEARVAGLYAQEALCPHCGHVNVANRQLCSECHGAMPVEHFSDLLKGRDKDNLIREGIQCGILFAVMLLAMALSYNLPTFGKLLVLVLTFAGLSWRFLRVVQEN